MNPDREQITLPDDYRPTRESLSNSEVRATGILVQGAVLNIARELLHSRERVIQLERALRDLLKYCPLSGDLAVMVRCMQGGGEDAQAIADRLVDHYSHLDEAQDAACAALEGQVDG
jgi:hypothetical protein